MADMLKSMIYGGVAAKVRVMYRRRLRADDYRALSEMTSEAEVYDYLQTHTSYGDALSVPGARVEEAVSATVSAEFERLYKFMQREDHPLLKCARMREEADELLRQAQGSKQSSYPLVRTVIDTRYYSNVFAIIAKKYKGDVAVKLMEGFGGEVDMLNVLAVLRIKEFFPDMRGETSDYLIPLRNKLSPKLLRSIIEAQDWAAAEEIIINSPLSKLFPDGVISKLDSALERRAYRFNLRIMRSPEPSVYTPLAYIFLRKAELQSVKKLIECVRYGVRAADVGVYIPGMEGGDLRGS